MTSTKVREFLEGHSDLAAYIATDAELEIYRRFRRLSVRNILYLQSELASLELKIDEYDLKEQEQLLNGSDAEKMDVWQCNRDWETFARRATIAGGTASSEYDERQKLRFEAIMKLRQVTADYRMRGFAIPRI